MSVRVQQRAPVLIFFCSGVWGRVLIFCVGLWFILQSSGDSWLLVGGSAEGAASVETPVTGVLCLLASAATGAVFLCQLNRKWSSCQGHGARDLFHVTALRMCGPMGRLGGPRRVLGPVLQGSWEQQCFDSRIGWSSRGVHCRTFRERKDMYGSACLSTVASPSLSGQGVCVFVFSEACPRVFLCQVVGLIFFPPPQHSPLMTHPSSRSDVLSAYFGESEAILRQVFSRARLHAPCILFLDDLDTIAPSRGVPPSCWGVVCCLPDNGF